MATRSYIGREYDDGSVRAVYCHWDGYPSNNGRILMEHWKDENKIESMLDEGDMSSLGNEVGLKHDFSSRGSDCTFYRRDRGESDCEARPHPNRDDFLKGSVSRGTDYAYLYSNGQWECWSLSIFDGPKYINMYSVTFESE